MIEREAARSPGERMDFIAIVTPTPDPITMLLATVPLFVLFEASILLAAWLNRVSPPGSWWGEGEEERVARWLSTKGRSTPEGGRDPWSPSAYGGEGTGHAETILAGRNLVAPIPDVVTHEQACFTTLGSIALNAVRMGIYRMRLRYGQILREEIAQTVGSESEIDLEIGHLLESL